MWFLSLLDPDSPVYNMNAAFRLQGSLEPSALEAALRALTARHDVLRTSVRNENVIPVPVVADDKTFTLEIVDPLNCDDDS